MLSRVRIWNPMDCSTPPRVLCPCNSPGKSTGVSCYFLLQCMKVKSEREVTQSCPTLSDPMDRSLPCSSVHGIFQARVLEWVAIAFSSVQFSRLVVSDSLLPHESQHTRSPCPSPTPGVYQTHVHRVGDAIQPSHPLSFPSCPAPNPSQH